MASLHSAIMTDATCAENCWYAREETCRCSCGGANHGVLRTKDGTRPERTCKIQGVQYRLHCIGNSIEVSHELGALHDYLERHPDSAPVKWYATTERKSASGAQKQWPEVAAWCAAHPHDYCYLGWVRTSVPGNLPIHAA